MGEPKKDDEKDDEQEDIETVKGAPERVSTPKKKDEGSSDD